MAEYSYGSIKIGGNLSKKQQTEIVNILEADYPDLLVDSIDQLTDFIVEEVTGDVLFFEFDHLPYGEFEYLENYCQMNKISFMSYAAASFDYPEERKIYNPKNSGIDYPRTIISAYGEDMIPSKDLVSVLNQLNSIQTNKAYDKIQEVISQLNRQLYPNTELPPVVLRSK
jgi:hypothetical protein